MKREYRILPDIDIFSAEDIFLVQKRKQWLCFKWWSTVCCKKNFGEAEKIILSLKKNEVF